MYLFMLSGCNAEHRLRGVTHIAYLCTYDDGRIVVLPTSDRLVRHVRDRRLPYLLRVVDGAQHLYVDAVNLTVQTGTSSHPGGMLASSTLEDAENEFVNML